MQQEKPSPQESDPDKKKVEAKSRDYMKYSGMVFQMGIIILIGTWGGKKLDERLQTSKPYFTVALALVSIFVALYSVLKDLIRRP